MLPRSSYVPPIVVRYMSGTCSVYVRFYTEHIPDIYRTYTGHIPDMYRRCYLAVCLFHWRSLLGIIEVFTRYYRDMLVFFPCMLYVGLYIVRFTKIRILFKSRFLKQRNLPYGDSFFVFFSEISINNRRKAMLN